MFKWLKRTSDRAPWSRVADGKMQVRSFGRLPEDVAAGGPEHEPTPEYIAEATTPSEEAWAREQALYRAKEEAERGDQ